MYDNRDSKKNPKSPDFRCKDKSCLDDKGFATALWEKDIIKKGGVPAAPANAKQPLSSGGPLPWEKEDALPHEKLDKMFNVYDACLDHAHIAAIKRFGKDVTDTAVAAMAATLYIDARKSGL